MDRITLSMPRPSNRRASHVPGGGVIRALALVVAGSTLLAGTPVAWAQTPKTVGKEDSASVSFPRVHRVFSNLKTWLAGTHHGVSGKHLPWYLNEFVFRFNRRKTPMAAFQSLLGLAGQHRPTTYKMLYTTERTG